MRKSAGILAYRQGSNGYEVFLVHPGGPFWKNKDRNGWSVPKGEFPGEEDPFAAAKREFGEETGFVVTGSFIPLNPVKQPGGKLIYLWAVETDFDAEAIRSNTFPLEWPPRSGKIIEVPEVDKAAWFPLDIAREKIHKGQIPFLEQLASVLAKQTK